MSTKESLPNFPKLKEPERYSAWSFFLETYLQGEGLFDYVNGENPEPFPLVLNTTTNTYSRAPFADEAAKKKQKASTNHTSPSFESTRLRKPYGKVSGKPLKTELPRTYCCGGWSSHKLDWKTMDRYNLTSIDYSRLHVNLRELGLRYQNLYSSW